MVAKPSPPAPAPTPAPAVSEESAGVPHGLGFGNLIATCLRWSGFWAIFAFTFIVMLVLAPFASPRKIFPFLSFMFRRMVRVVGLRVKVVGREKLDPKRGYVYMIHHASVLDHFVMAGLSPMFVVGVEKASNFTVPVYGWFTGWWGNIPIVREEREKAFAAIDVAKERIRSGISVGVAPEGTRQLGGVLGPFKKGGFHLARETGAQIVPIALIGIGDRNPDRKFRLVGGPVTVEFHDPISTGESEGTIDDLVERVRAALKSSGYR